LLALGGKIDYRDSQLNTPLHAIARNCNDTTFAEYLVLHCADLNSRNKAGQTPLMLALESKNHHMSEYLIDRQTTLNQKDYAGNSLLNQIVKSDCQPELVEKLIELYNADIIPVIYQSLLQIMLKVQYKIVE